MLPGAARRSGRRVTSALGAALLFTIAGCAHRGHPAASGSSSTPGRSTTAGGSTTDSGSAPPGTSAPADTLADPTGALPVATGTVIDRSGLGPGVVRVTTSSSDTAVQVAFVCSSGSYTFADGAGRDVNGECAGDSASAMNWPRYRGDLPATVRITVDPGVRWRIAVRVVPAR